MCVSRSAARKTFFESIYDFNNFLGDGGQQTCSYHDSGIALDSNGMCAVFGDRNMSEDVFLSLKTNVLPFSWCSLHQLHLGSAINHHTVTQNLFRFSVSLSLSARTRWWLGKGSHGGLSVNGFTFRNVESDLLGWRRRKKRPRDKSWQCALLVIVLHKDSRQALETSEQALTEEALLENVRRWWRNEEALQLLSAPSGLSFCLERGT